MKLFGRRINPSVVFLGVLALVFVVVAPLRAATRLGQDEPAAEPKQLTDRAATAPATPRAVPSPPANRADPGTSRRTASTDPTDDRDPLQRLDDALTRRQRADSGDAGAQWRPGSADGRRSDRDPSGGSSDAGSGPRDEAPQRLAHAVRDLADLLGGDAPRR